jgi:LAO/AO transport system kinase
VHSSPLLSAQPSFFSSPSAQNQRTLTQMSEARPTLESRLLAGERAALARGISWAERSDPRFPALLRSLWPHVGRGMRTGITGPPGAGKSTLVNEIARVLREQDKQVGILAVDPSSPFTGGALLGDRIRMEDRTMDTGVFIRSMASRGSHGGIARAAVDACDVMDAFGFGELIVETVGVGQAEYDIVSAADTVVVVLCPGAGDSVQAMKAGLLEVADVMVVNKSDLRGADRLASDLEEAVHIRTAGRGVWEPPVVTCSAGKSQGVGAVLEAIESHRSWLADGRLAGERKRRRIDQVERVVSEGWRAAIWEEGSWRERVATELTKGEQTPYDVASHLLGELLPKAGDSSTALDSGPFQSPSKSQGDSE